MKILHTEFLLNKNSRVNDKEQPWRLHDVKVDNKTTSNYAGIAICWLLTVLIFDAVSKWRRLLALPRWYGVRFVFIRGSTHLTLPTDQYIGNWECGRVGVHWGREHRIRSLQCVDSEAGSSTWILSVTGWSYESPRTGIDKSQESAIVTMVLTDWVRTVLIHWTSQDQLSTLQVKVRVMLIGVQVLFGELSEL